MASLGFFASENCPAFAAVAAFRFAENSLLGVGEIAGLALRSQFFALAKNACRALAKIPYCLIPQALNFRHGAFSPTFGGEFSPTLDFSPGGFSSACFRSGFGSGTGSGQARRWKSFPPRWKKFPQAVSPLLAQLAWRFISNCAGFWARVLRRLADEARALSLGDRLRGRGGVVAVRRLDVGAATWGRWRVRLGRHVTNENQRQAGEQ